MNTAVYETIRSDPDLAPYVEKHGELAVEPADDLFRRLLVSVVRQQVSMDAADAIQRRLFDAVEATPAAICEVDGQVLREAGLSRAKVTYAKNVARTFVEKDYDRSYFETLDDHAVMAEITEITGIGPWTAKMFLLFGLGRPDVFPVEDLGIRRGMEIACGCESTRTEMRERARAWEPYRSYASLYLWRAYEE